MIGLSPRTPSLTPRQIQTSAEIAQAVPEFPQTISDLISEMAVFDFSLLEQDLELDKNGGVIQHQRNLQIIACIELALTLPSSECDPKIKAAIFYKAVNQSTSSVRMPCYLIDIVNGLKRKGQQIILDDVEFKNLNVSIQSINLSGMSARRANFQCVNMNSMDLAGVDFTGAKFTDCSFVWGYLNDATITDATFSHVNFFDTEAYGLTGNQSEIFKQVDRRKQSITVDGVTTLFDDVYLTGNRVTATADSEIVTLPAKINYPQLGQSLY